MPGVVAVAVGELDSPTHTVTTINSVSMFNQHVVNSVTVTLHG